MDSSRKPAGAMRLGRSRSWQFAVLLALGGAVVVACGGGDKGGNGLDPGIAAAIDILTQPPTNATTRVTLGTAPVVQIVDVLGDPVDTAGITVTASLNGGGTLTGTTTAITDAFGQASFGNLQIRGLIGAKSLTFSASQVTGVQSNPITLAAGPAAALVSNSATSQNGLKGAPVTAKPSVKATDLDGNGIAGANVTFAITVGNGSLTGGGQVTDGAGVATVGSWTLDTAAGANTMTATSAGLTGSPVTFNATGGNVTSQFTIDLQFLLPPTAGQQLAFNNAKAKWEQLIIGDIANQTVNIAADPNCGNVPINGTIDDVRILVLLDSIDGPSGILGAAGPCYIRNPGVLTIVGLMNFDTADVAALESNGTLSDVVFHEMGHVLGYGTLWNSFGLLNGSGTTNPFFSGDSANTYYLTEGGAASVVPNTTGCVPGATEAISRTSVPVENSGGGGTANSHWEDCVFKSEVLTGYISGTIRPLSKTSLGSMADMGYIVNFAAADNFNLATQPTVRAGDSGAETVPLVDLTHDGLNIPIKMLDNRGRVVGIYRH